MLKFYVGKNTEYKIFRERVLFHYDEFSAETNEMGYGDNCSCIPAFHVLDV